MLSDRSGKRSGSAARRAPRKSESAFAFGSVLGALLLGLIGNVIFFAGLPFAYQTLAQGVIILAALAGGVLIARRPA